MKITIELSTQRFLVNTDFAWNLAIPLHFNPQQPNHFNAKNASTKAMQADNFIGDTTQGGSCNVNELSLNPHCNGTHTETIAHICDFDAPLSLMISEIILPTLIPSVLISLTPELAMQNTDSYRPAFTINDKIVSRDLLKLHLKNYKNEQCQAIIIRTLPNELDKQTTHYNQDNQPAFFSREAILYLNERGVEHLLVDIPSIDRLHDDGLMTCHHLFWQVGEGEHQPSPTSLINKTITEMTYINNQISDGFYFVNIQTPAFVNDAAPSRPMLYAAQTIATTV